MSGIGTGSDFEQGPFEPIAIIGMACILPDAPDVTSFWKNVQDAHVSFRDVPEERWDPIDFYSEERQENMTYSKIGAFVEGYEFDWRRWRLPPGTLSQIDICQQWAVSVSAAALEDAGYMGEGAREPPRPQTAVIFANALGGENRNLSNQRVWAKRTLRIAKQHGLTNDDQFISDITEGTPKIDEDTMPGELANVVAGRVANLLDLQGPNYSTDAACASSMAAILDASRQLQLRQIDMAVAGASDRTMDPATYAKFSAIGALSATHSRPFDASADGFVMGEGAGAFVLKRLSDAIADNDRIYSVIRGIGASSDGRGKGITAPSRRGQQQAVERAYSQAGYPASSVGLIEAHGTSTRVGDATELATLNEIFSNGGEVAGTAIGSIKSQIGHLKAAAGIAGMLKTTLALHHQVIPPSAGFEDPNDTVDWDSLPFYVPTNPSSWSDSDIPLRAGVSAFGFGGTNFHVAMERYDGEIHIPMATEWDRRWEVYSGKTSLNPTEQNTPPQPTPEIEPTMSWNELKGIEGGILLLNGDSSVDLKTNLEKVKSKLLDGQPTFDESPDGARLSECLSEVSQTFVCEGIRLAIVAIDWKQLEKRIDLALESLHDQTSWSFLASQDIFISDTPLQAGVKAVHAYPGQGSQYVGMSYDLSRRFSIVQATWDEADETMVEVLDGRTLSGFVLLNDLNGEQRAAAEAELMQTEHTQPAMLTTDLALDRLLAQHGQIPDMVAGHSLGEYAALTVSGILDFRDALRAAAARGTEMGSVEVTDCGLMASVSAPSDEIDKILEQVDGYVIAANRNSPRMTVIAGETDAIKDAIARFDEVDVNSVILATSHAFHTSIVAPANIPLEKFLNNLDISLPSLPITSNYDGEFYPMTCEEGFSVHETILPQLAPQMSSPVEWTRQIGNMYDEGAKIFVEVGPKRALTTFSSQILEDEPHIAVMTNHPKLGGIRSFLCALGQLSIAGRPIEIPDLGNPIHTQAFRAGPLEATKPALENPDIDETEKLVTHDELHVTSASVSTQNLITKEEWVGALCADISGFPATVCRGNVDLRNGLRLSDEQVNALITRIKDSALGEGDIASARTINDLVNWISQPPQIVAKEGTSIHRQSNVPQNVVEVRRGYTADNTDRKHDPYVVSGISLGLPGMDQVFEPDALERIINGENFITELSEELKQRLLDKNLVRIVKHPDGNVELVKCEGFEMIPQLAGRGGYFDLAEQYGIDSKIVDAMDATTTLSFAAGLEALSDAALPLFPVEQVSGAGKRLVKGWHLAPSIRDSTGVVFASVFPGINMAMRHAANNGADENGTFDRRFLLQVLTMGHSQFAQWIGARGPNAAINNACASTPAAFAIAEDWITTGRCERVIVISGDDSTSDELMEWIGAGFAAAGAHAMGNVPSEVSLPFDARRNGMLLGMGGAAFVIERASHAEHRGVVPYAELLGAHIGNSAYHPTRLDVDHVSDSLDKFIGRMEDQWGFDRHEIAPVTTFMSHEPATPPRGGSAAAEISALRSTFGTSASSLIISNTKGFTGHPMGAGIEDAVVLYGLAAGKLPPIANFKEPDPNLGDLRLSDGGDYDVEYALRHAAGFGSQLSLTLFRRVAHGLNRIRREKVESWSRNQVSKDIDLRLLDRKLVAWIDADENLIGGVKGEKWDVEEFDADVITSITSTAATVVDTAVEPEREALLQTDDGPKEETIVSPTSPHPISKVDAADDIIEQVMATVVEHTGYPADFIELDQDLEGELGVDSVKQAEIMADIRAHFELPVDETFVLSEHPTLNHMIAYIVRMLGGETSLEEDAPVSEPIVESAAEQISDDSSDSQSDNDKHPVPTQETDEVTQNIRTKVLEVVVEHTGYPEDFIGFDQDLEGELGVDSVKQAEMMADLRIHFDLIQDENFILAEHPTLNHIVAYISGTRSESISLEKPDVQQDAELQVVDKTTRDSESIESSTTPPLPSTTSVFEGVRRWQVEVEELAELSGEELQLSGSTVLITDEDWGITDVLAGELNSRGINTIRLNLDPSCRSFNIHERDGISILSAHPSSSEQISEVVNYLQDVKSFAGVIHLAPLNLTGISWSSENNTSQNAISSVSLFLLLSGLHTKLTSSPGIITSVSALDGRHGNRSGFFNSVAAGSHGVVKSFSKEKNTLTCKALDIHPELLMEPIELAQRILAEILSTDSPVEVGVDRDGRRWRLVLFEEDLVDDSEELDSSDVILASGGGSGVTATSLISLSSRCSNAGATFVLLGRTELIPETADWIDWDEEKLEQRKHSLRDTMLEEYVMDSRPQKKVSIVEWENAWQPYLRSLDINATIDAIESCGNTAIYRSCDVLELDSVISVGKEIGKKYGPITIIVHGAGVEDSKLVGDKDLVTFERVLNIKTKGWINLMSAQRESGSEQPRIACCFTSIAGRFGNIGQTDYAAANNVLDAEMARLTAAGDSRGLAIAWTGWKDVGMATKGSIEKLFQSAGIETTSVEDGVNIFTDEILRGGKRRVVAAGALGVLDKDGVKREAPLLLSPEVASLLAEVGRMPLIGKLQEFEPSFRLVAQTTLDTEAFPFLIDHAIDGTPYLPGVMVLESFAQCALLLNPTCVVHGFDDVDFGLPVKLTGVEQTVRIRAEAISEREIFCSMESDIRNSSGVIFGEPKQHHQATVILSDSDDEPLEADMSTPRRGEIEIAADFIYERFFHGPSFQCHGGLIRGISEGRDLGAEGLVLQRNELPQPHQFQIEEQGANVQLESLPMLLEAAFQNAGLVMMEKAAIQALPIGISSSRISRRPHPGERLLIRTICRSSDEQLSVHDALIVPESARDELLMVIKGIKLKTLAPLPKSQHFEMERL